ncbi:MAG: UDP-N-acetylmuramoyl-tripeptide--D-alanyl-D-alanine ligase [Betaproteobacteria bacterium]|nr:UDP-N-acetylmuramoyl-tripeptide--D-alanyl-D-alanine ligase [Betaproteobacteria bacterium]
MMRLSEAARALGGEVCGADVAFEGVVSDSRAAKKGDLFVALRGERLDGHRFVAQAAAAGACAAMVEERGLRIEDRGMSDQISLLIVDDTIRALGRLGAYWRANFTMPLVALTGSNGKTTVKEMLAQILREACAQDASRSSVLDPESRVLATRGNLNNHIGVPLMLLELRAAHCYAVIEMGMNHVGEIAYLTRLAAPGVALVTNIGRVHLEGLGSLETAARAKGEIFEGLQPSGAAVINADDRFAPLWRRLAGDRRRVEFGLEAPAQVSARYKLGDLQSEIVVNMPHGEARALLQAPGLHNVRNALAASAAAVALAAPAAAIARGLAHFRGVKGRLQKKACINGATLIDDTYNANPESVRAAIEVLAAAPGTRLLVLGDMGELGPGAAGLHAETGRCAREAGIERLLTLGELSEHAARAFGAGARHFTRIEDLLAEIENTLTPQVTVLVKGSRFMQMERVVKSFEFKVPGSKSENKRV